MLRGLNTVELTDTSFFKKKIMDSKESKNEPEFLGAIEEASKTEHTARAAVAEHRARVISHLNNGDIDGAVAALMTDQNGRQLSYGESRMMYG